MESEKVNTSVEVSQIDLQNNQAWKINRSDPNKCIFEATEVLSLAKNINYTKGIAEAISSIGASHVWLGEYDHAVKNLLEANRIAKQLQFPLLEARIYYHLFCAFYFLSDHEQALRYAYESLEQAKLSGNKSEIANALNGIGTVYYSTQENEKALDALTDALAFAQEGNDKAIETKILDGLGETHLNLHNVDEALHYKKLSLEKAKEIGFDMVIAYALDGIGKVNILKKEFPKALEFYEESLRIRRQINFKAGQCDSFLLLGTLHLLMGKIEAALCYLEEALIIAKEMESATMLFKVHKALADLYERSGDLSLFIEHLKKHYEFKEIFNSKKNNQKQRTLEIQSEVEKIEQEKDLLEKKNRELQAANNDVITLSELGKKITSSLSVEDINNTVYSALQTLMDAPSFGIGVYHEENNTISFPGYLEDGKNLGEIIYDLNDNNRLANLCFNEEKEILISDLENDLPKFVKVKKAPLAGRHVNSVIYLPLKVKGKKVGVITAQSFNKHAYSEYHQNLLRNLAVYAAIAVDNAQLYTRLEEIVEERSVEVIRQKEEIEKSYSNIQLLSEIGQQITASLDFESIFHKLHENVNILVPADCFGIRIYHPDKNEIEYKFEIEKGQRYEESIFVSMDNDDNYSVWCLKNKEVVFLNDNRNEYHKYVKKIVVPSGEMPDSLIFSPIQLGDQVLGVITVQSFRKNAYTAYHVDILKTLGTYTAIALVNADMYEKLELMVKDRTAEVVKQKEEIEKSFENTKLLSEIGNEILSTLSIDKIIDRVYNHINRLMDASAFGIGIYRPAHNDLFHPGVVENGNKLSPFSFDLNEDRLASRCFKKREEYIIYNWEEQYKSYVSEDYKPVQGENPVSLIYLPLISKGAAIGVLSVQSFKKNAYNDYHLAVLRNIAVLMGSALENANLYESLEEKVKERTEEITKAYENTKLLGQIAKDISASLSVETIIQELYSNINTLMDAASFGIGIYNEKTNFLTFPGFMEKGNRLDNLEFSVNDDRLASWCFKNQQEIFTNNFVEDYKKYLSGIQAPVAGKQSTSIIYIPLFIKEKIMGVLTVQSYNENAYSEYHLDILRNLSHSIAIAIDNATLYSSLEDKVKERTAEVVKQKEVIEEKNKHITDSIVYAKRIQQAILPPEDVFKTHLQNSFILYKPKDIVSGDFYWLERKGNKILFAVVDCTGHGVPGAFMSIIGYNGLNQIVNEYNVQQPAEILNNLNKIITTTLKQHAHESKIRDGMDMSVCCIDLDTNKLQFAGANNPIFIVRNNQVVEIKADKQPIGNFIGEEEFRFTNKELDLFPSDRLYLFSDGFADQFGGPRGKKLKYTMFRELLIENHQLPMQEQKELLDRLFENWRGELEQIDDVCVIGVAI